MFNLLPSYLFMPFNENQEPSKVVATISNKLRLNKWILAGWHTGNQSTYTKQTIK